MRARDLNILWKYEIPELNGNGAMIAAQDKTRKHNKKNSRKSSSSMPEMPDTSEEQSNPVLVTAVYGISISNAPTRLCNYSNPIFTCLFHGIFPGCYETISVKIIT